MDALYSLQELVANVPRYIDEQGRLSLIVIAVVATAAGVGTVTRNHEFGWISKFVVATLIFAVVFAMGLALAYFVPVMAEMGRASQGPAR